MLATNFGMIISEDAGKSWLWTCERPETSFGYLYGVGPPPRDRFYALSPDAGLAFSDDGSCTWQRVGRRARVSGRERLLRRSRRTPDRVARRRGAGRSMTGDIGPPAVFAVDGRRHDLRRDAALHRARGRERRQRGDRAQQSDGRSTWRCTRRPASPSRASCARPTAVRPGWSATSRRRSAPTNSASSTVDPDDRERPLPARDRAGHGERRGDARRGHDLRDARDDHEAGR